MMPKLLPAVHERPEELLTLLNTLSDRERKTRVHALFLAKQGYCPTRVAIAHALCVERKAVERWFTQYETGGLHALLVSHRHRCGKKPRLAGEALTQLTTRLSGPEGFHGYQSICPWVKEQWGLELPYQTVYSIVHGNLQAKPKVPRKSNVKQDPEQVLTFKKKSLPSSYRPFNSGTSTIYP